MKVSGPGRRKLPAWFSAACILVALVVIVWIYYGKLYATKKVDVFKLDPRNPENVKIFNELDSHYKTHPEKRPSNWPPRQFTPENIAKAREESRQQWAESDKKRAKVMEEYFRQPGLQGRGAPR